MSRIGIVAEFNPFHTGHKYIIDYAKNELKADSVVIALGNEFTQRGGLAVLDRYSRAECAIDAGADLVIGMPAIASVSSAEIFAECGVCLLHACGCERIVCGYEGVSESEDSQFACTSSGVSAIKDIARVLSDEPSEYKAVLKKELSSGKSFPAARESALSGFFHSDKVHDLVSNPNNILAIEYQKAIIRHGFDIELIPVKRQGTGYNDSENDGVFVSASYIRNQINGGNLSAVRNHLTDFSYKALNDACNKNVLLSDNDLSLPLHLALLSHDDYRDFLDVSDDLSDRITKLLPEYTGFSKFTELIKNKSLTASRVRRALIHILLGITDDDLSAFRARGSVPYLWVLKTSKTGRSMLKEIKSSAAVPLFMSTNELTDKDIISEDLKTLSLVRALRIHKSGILLPNEFQRKVHL